MIGTYYKKEVVRMCELVTVITPPQLIATSTDGSTLALSLDCCDLNACATTCNHGGTDTQIEEAFQRVGYPHRKLNGAITEEYLQSELSSGRPVMLYLQSDLDQEVDGQKKTSAHVRVVSGFSPPKGSQTTRYHVLDSAVPEARDDTYAELLAEPKEKGIWQYRWEATWLLIPEKIPACAPQTP
jgi:hypothetical protein